MIFSTRLPMQPRRPRMRAQTVAIAALAWLGTPAVDAQPNADVAAAVSACQRLPGGSSRLDCYDRAFPPLVAAQAEQDAATRSESDAARRDEQSAAAAPASRDATADEPVRASADRAHIVELQIPSLTTTVLVAADGRVFVRENGVSILRWPDAPFDVDIETSRFGSSTYLIHPGTHQRVRVAVRDQTGLSIARPRTTP